MASNGLRAAGGVAKKAAKKADKQLAAEAADAALGGVRDRFECGRFSVLLGLDPGVNAQTVAEMPVGAAGSDAYLGARPGRVHHCSRSVSKAEFSCLTGAARRTKLTAGRRQRDPSIVAFEATQGTFKTADPERFLERCRQYFAAAPTLLEFYVISRFFRRLRFDTYVRGQRGRQAAIDKLLSVRTAVVDGRSGPRTVLLKQPGQEKDILVGLGDGHRLFNQQLEAELRRRATVVDIDEFRTSQRSSKSLVELRGKPLSRTKVLCLEGQETVGRLPGGVGTCVTVSRRPVKAYNITLPWMDGSDRRKTSFAVRTATQPSGVRERWNRDVSASIWIVFKLWLKMRGAEEELPAVMRRPAAAA